MKTESNETNSFHFLYETTKEEESSHFVQMSSSVISF